MTDLDGHSREALTRAIEGNGVEFLLGTSEAGYSVYRRIGFEDVCRTGLYEWRDR